MSASTANPVAATPKACVARIRSLYPEMTKTERKVADYILATSDVIYMTILEFAESCGVGYGSVIRFCQRLGYSGFQDLKIQLAEDSAHRRLRERLDAAGDSETLLPRMINEAINEIRNTGELLSEEAIEQAATAIAGCDFVLIAGLSSSAATALDIEYRMARFGIRASAAVDNHMQRLMASKLTPKDVAFLLSFSGSTKEIIATGEIARETGAQVISLTNFLESPVAKVANTHLVTGVAMEPLSAEVPSRVAVSFVVTLLFARIAELRSGAEDSLSQTFRATADRQL